MHTRGGSQGLILTAYRVRVLSLLPFLCKRSSTKGTPDQTGRMSTVRIPNRPQYRGALAAGPGDGAVALTVGAPAGGVAGEAVRGQVGEKRGAAAALVDEHRAAGLCEVGWGGGSGRERRGGASSGA
jgi:hypothetical protein